MVLKLRCFGNIQVRRTMVSKLLKVMDEPLLGAARHRYITYAYNLGGERNSNKARMTTMFQILNSPAK